MHDQIEITEVNYNIEFIVHTNQNLNKMHKYIEVHNNTIMYIMTTCMNEGKFYFYPNNVKTSFKCGKILLKSSPVDWDGEIFQSIWTFL
jgi:hypothetical protein